MNVTMTAPSPALPDSVRDVFDSVVVVSPFYWNFRDDIPGTTHHIAAAFSTYLPTVFIEPSPQWNPRSEQFRVHRLPSALGGPLTRRARPALTVFHRRAVPLGRSTAIQRFDAARNGRNLQRYLAAQRLQRPLVWHSFPYGSQTFLDAVHPRLFAYHCLDYTSQALEHTLITRADVVFCVSETLVERHRHTNPRTFHLPNGVNLDLYDLAAARRAPRPADIPRDRRVIGFLGCINHHLDIGLIVKVAKAFPGDSVVLVGKVATNETAPRPLQRTALEELKQLPNVQLLGFKPTADVPAYLHAFDVCLIPFLNDPFNRECDPLKFYEYSALGKPIVATDVPVAERYADACYRTSSDVAFIEAVGAALVERAPAELQARRLGIARSHAWPTIAGQALTKLASMVQGRA